MKVLIGLVALSTILLTTFQNCAKNNAVQFGNVATEKMDANITDEQAQNLPPLADYKSCVVPETGATVSHLYYRWGVKTTTGTYNGSPSNKVCDLMEIRQCFDGAMNRASGQFDASDCVMPDWNKNSPATASCTIDGRTIAHGQLMVVYGSPVVTGANNCIGQFRRCNNGTLSGSSTYSHSTCGEGSYKPASGKAYDCQFNGKTVPDGSIIIAFKSESGDANGLCYHEPRRCVQGRLDGSFTKNSCNPNAK